MHAVLVTLFILGAFIEVVGLVTVVAGYDQRHWGAVAVFAGAVICVSVAIVMDGLS